MRRKEVRSKQGLTNNKAKQHSTCTCSASVTIISMAVCVLLWNIPASRALASYAVHTLTVHSTSTESYTLIQ